MMVPILALNNPEAACLELAEHFGFRQVRPGIVSLGDQEISLVDIGTTPQAMIPLRLDHVALSVADADRTHRQICATGARLDQRFTPDGPRTISEFWKHGARFVFFEGPEGWPLEFCARLEVKRFSDRIGHDHYGIRTSDIEKSQRELLNRGAVLIAEHQLANAGNMVNVRFLQWGEGTIELFDEVPVIQTPRQGGWIGVLET